MARIKMLPNRTRKLAARLKLMAGYLAGPDDVGPEELLVSPARRPILLLHGFGSSRRMLSPLQSHLRKSTGRVVIRIGISAGRDDLRDSARRVEQVLARLAQYPDFEYADVVGHSMGGLVATYLLKQMDRGCRIRNVVTLGTPHRGTPSAFLGVLAVGLFSEAIWQMLPDSSFVRELKWVPVPEGCELVSIAGAYDMLVPESFTRLAPLPGHRNVRCDDANHVKLLFSRPTMRLLRGALARAGSDPVSLERAA